MREHFHIRLPLAGDLGGGWRGRRFRFVAEQVIAGGLRGLRCRQCAHQPPQVSVRWQRGLHGSDLLREAGKLPGAALHEIWQRVAVLVPALAKCQRGEDGLEGEKFRVGLAGRREIKVARKENAIVGAELGVAGFKQRERFPRDHLPEQQQALTALGEGRAHGRSRPLRPARKHAPIQRPQPDERMLLPIKHGVNFPSPQRHPPRLLVPKGRNNKAQRKRGMSAALGHQS